MKKILSLVATLGLLFSVAGWCQEPVGTIYTCPKSVNCAMDQDEGKVVCKTPDEQWYVYFQYPSPPPGTYNFFQARSDSTYQGACDYADSAQTLIVTLQSQAAPLSACQEIQADECRNNKWSSPPVSCSSDNPKQCKFYSPPPIPPAGKHNLK